MKETKLKKQLRADLKAAGYNNKRVGVTNQIGAFCWGIYVTIKDSGVDKQVVREIAKKYEKEPSRTICGDANTDGFLVMVMEEHGFIVT